MAPSPRAAESQTALVTSQLANELTLVDLDAGTISARIPISGAPAGIALSPDRKRAYVTRPEAQALAIVDIDARNVTASVPLPGGPLGIAVHPLAGTVFVADWYGARVFVLEPSSDGLVASGEIAVGQSPSGLAVTPDGRQLLVANREADSVSFVDLATRTEQARLSVGRHPFGLTLSSDGTRAYTANVISNDVSVIDVPGHREIGRVTTGERPYVVALADGRGFVTDQYSGTVTAFGLADLKPLATIEVGDHPEGIATTRDGHSLIVANWGDNTLSRIDAQTLKVTATVPVSDGPRAFGDFLR